MGRDLARRVAESTGTAAAEHQDQEEQRPPQSLADQIRSMEREFQAAMPKGTEATQLVRDALTCLRTTPRLAQCEARSVLGGLMTCAQLGLRPGVPGLNHVWLVPFWDQRARMHRAQIVLGYQGLIELAHRSGRVASLYARTVYEGDQFDVEYGLADTLTHRPNLFGERGRPIAYYAVVKYTSGGHVFYVMTRAEVETYRDKHATARDRNGAITGPWNDHFEPMAHKTCIRQLSRWMPRSVEFAAALSADESVRVDLSPEADAAWSAQHIEGELVDEDGESAEVAAEEPS